MEKRHCEGHGIALPIEEFGKKKGRFCKACSTDKVTAYYFGFSSVLDLFDFREERENRCDICGRQWQPGGRMFAIDHDKRCVRHSPKGREGIVSCRNCVRGFLCHACNSRGVAWYEEVGFELEKLKGKEISEVSPIKDYLDRFNKHRQPCEGEKYNR